ncbi:unnamed protein product [Caenorhabditis bovis]|uniref:G-protein coupled receptors family 1 profile domain-containing protein n=1 Tax=Caenorhabditis bovis TaxID=2654633 RepID=A0A8S1ECA0_9PELO|nr:unnamed protein product [Caenorhabditis bovis]
MLRSCAFVISALSNAALIALFNKTPTPYFQRAKRFLIAFASFSIINVIINAFFNPLIVKNVNSVFFVSGTPIGNHKSIGKLLACLYFFCYCFCICCLSALFFQRFFYVSGALMGCNYRKLKYLFVIPFSSILMWMTSHDPSGKMNICYDDLIAMFLLSIMTIGTIGVMIFTGYKMIKCNLVSGCEKCYNMNRSLNYTVIAQGFITLSFYIIPMFLLILSPIISINIDILAEFYSISSLIYPAINAICAMLIIDEMRYLIFRTRKLFIKPIILLTMHNHRNPQSSSIYVLL